LCHRVGKKNAVSEQSSDEEDISVGKCDGSHSNGSTEENNTKNSDEEDTTTTMISKRNYFKVVNEKSMIQTELEHTTENGQKNRQWKLIKNRKWEGGETIPKGKVCLLKLSDEKNTAGVKELPVVITSLHYYKQSGNIRYKVASKDGHITGSMEGKSCDPKNILL